MLQSGLKAYESSFESHELCGTQPFLARAVRTHPPAINQWRRRINPAPPQLFSVIDLDETANHTLPKPLKSLVAVVVGLEWSLLRHTDVTGLLL